MSEEPGDRPAKGVLDVFRDLGPFLWEARWIYIPGALFAVFTLGTQLLQPQLVRIIINSGIEDEDAEAIQWMALVMLGVAAFQAVAWYLHTYCFELGEVRVTAALRSWLFANLMKQEVGFYDANNSGELMSRLSADANTVSRLLNPWLSEGIRFGLLGLCVVPLLIYTSPQLSVATLLLAPVLAAGTSYLGRRLRVESQHVQDKEAGLSESALETLAGIRTVRVYHTEREEAERYGGRVRSFIKVATRRIHISAALESFSETSSSLAMTVGVVVGGMLIVSGSLDPGGLVTFMLYSGLAVRSLRNTSHFIAEAMRAQGATARIFELGRRTPRVPIEGGLAPDRIEGQISLEDVHFHYPTRPDEVALEGVDLVIPPGQLVALGGASGSGKSTIASLIARLYDPEQGSVRLDGRDLRDLDPAWLRQHVTLVPADATLFARSVAENIRYGRPEASHEEMVEVARAAFAAQFVEALPGGYEADSGDRGVRFSRGQQQRIAIARALLRRPTVLLLDEATAALDSEGEAMVKEGLRKLQDRPTIVIVAHRLSTVVDVDRVVMVEKGRIVADGQHAELLATSPAYRALFEDQLAID